MLQTIGELLPSAVGVAISPLPIVAVVLMLGTARARPVGTAFSAGWIAGLGLASTIVVLLTNGIDESDESPSTVVSTVKLVLGLALMALAVKRWHQRPRNGTVPEPPRWMSSIDSTPPARAAGLGFVLAGVNPKNLALTIAAASTIGAGSGGPARSAVAIVVFVLIGSATVVGPTLWYLLDPGRASKPLNELKDFMADHNTVIMIVLLVVLGTKLLGNGISGLAA